MEIIEQPDGQSCLLRLTKQEWIEMGDERGYLTPEWQQRLVPPDSQPIQPRPPSAPEACRAGRQVGTEKIVSAPNAVLFEYNAEADIVAFALLR